MKNWNTPENPVTRRVLRLACSTAVVAACAVSLPQTARADRITPPDVPFNLQVPEGNKAFLVGHATGTQNYVCLPCPNPTTPAKSCPDTSGFAWLLFTPEATLFGDNEQQVITHFFSPNPSEDGTIRATWQDSHDTSIVWGGNATVSTDAKFVEQGAVAWLTLPMAGVQGGPLGSDVLTATTFIQRVHTHGGVAPKDGCSQLSDVGAKAFMPYTADYFFYSKEPGN
jgi:hypothetical protein